MLGIMAEPIDLLLIGKTGMGKSTTGNTLLKAHSALDSQQPVHSRERFDAATSAESVTTVCKVVESEDHKLRIMDVPGFAPSTTLREGYTNVYEANLKILRDVLFMQTQNNLAFRRVLYFLPRGVLERADAILQEELNVMHYFLGSAIFESMVLVATERTKKSLKGALDDEDLEDSRKIFQVALGEVLSASASNRGVAAPPTPNPPIIYISQEDTGEEILRNLLDQKVVNQAGLRLKFSDDVCLKCAVKLRMVDGKPTCAIGKDGQGVDINELNCHPIFVRKFSKAERVWGGITTIATAGLAHALFEDEVPWFTDNKEICHNCRRGPGSPPCMAINSSYKYEQFSPPPSAARKMVTLTTEHNLAELTSTYVAYKED